MIRLALFSVLFLAFLSHTNAAPIFHPVRMLTISGKVISDESQQPVVSVLTIMGEDAAPIKVTTNVNGEFSTVIPVGVEYKVLARAQGFETLEEVVAVPDFEEQTTSYVEIKLTPYVKVTLDGLIRNNQGAKPLEAEFNVYYCSDFIKADSKKIRDGKIIEPLTHFGWYRVDLSAPGYQPIADTFWILNYNRKVIHKNYILASIETGFTMQLRNLNFNFGKATITSDSHPELDELFQFLKKNQTLQVEIGGHTDSDGPEDYNLILSQLRAQAVVDYLVDKGIDSYQVIAKGYGESKPLESNATEHGKAINRRVEMVVLKR